MRYDATLCDEGFRRDLDSVMKLLGTTLSACVTKSHTAYRRRSAASGEDNKQTNTFFVDSLLSVQFQRSEVAVDQIFICGYRVLSAAASGAEGEVARGGSERLQASQFV